MHQVHYKIHCNTSNVSPRGSFVLAWSTCVPRSCVSPALLRVHHGGRAVASVFRHLSLAFQALYHTEPQHDAAVTIFSSD